MSAIQQILWRRLDRDMTRFVGRGWETRPVMIYGAGGLGRSFMQTFPELDFVGAVDSDPERQGATIEGLPIISPEALPDRKDDPLVFITSAWYEEIGRHLTDLGLTRNQHFFYGNQQAHGRLFFYLPESAPFGEAFAKAFTWLESEDVDYAILRWFESLPQETPVDIDLLVRTADLPRLFENPHLTAEPGGIPLEVYWSEPLGHEDELLYYPTWLADEILTSRVPTDCGAHGPDPARYLRSLAYHAVFHKAERSGLSTDPITSAPSAKDAFNKYRARILQLARAEGLEIEPTLPALWQFLDREGWLPPTDLARRYATTLGSPWLTQQVGPLDDAREDTLVFVLREWLIGRPAALEAVLEEIEALGLVPIDLVPLSEDERAQARTQIRGSNWVESEASREGGGPAAFAVFHDPDPAPPSVADRLLRPFCTNRKLTGKTDLKRRIAERLNGGRLVNFLHAADDEREAVEYLECLAPDRRDALYTKIARFESREGRPMPRRSSHVD